MPKCQYLYQDTDGVMRCNLTNIACWYWVSEMDMSKCEQFKEDENV
jgi:hypothetical protein